MKADKILYNIGNLFCSTTKNGPLKGVDMNKATIMEDSYVAIIKDEILAYGFGNGEDYKDEATKLIDCKGKTVTPGLVDSHTHLVHGGSRENEFSKKLNGVSYLDILREGGGIHSTVKATNKASFEELYQKAIKSLNIMLSYGTTTVEAKSGYGLNLETEEKQLRVAKKLNEDHPIDVVSTFMGAHAVPNEYKGRTQDYINILINQMMPKFKNESLAEFCDVFCEHEVFSVEETRDILNSAKALGLKVKIHADEIVSLGGAELSAEVKAISAEHLMAASEEGMEAMAKENVIANLLPATTFSLMKTTYAQARKMMDKGCAIALSTDYNPGSCPTENIQMVMQLGCFAMKMTPVEVLNAVTVNGAFCLNRQDSIGSIEIGKKADLVIWDSPNIDYMFYHFGINHVEKVIKNGEIVFSIN
ncbi:MAG: imidazolonepropionase [Filifactoraceae bacterium]